MTSMKTSIATSLLGMMLLLNGAQLLLAQSTAFVYHGELSQRGRPARSEHDLRFELFSAPTNGQQIARGEVPDVRVQDGEFTVILDFGPGVFDSSDRWLEISVKQRHSDNFIPLRPRQQIMPVPYAIMAHSASNLLGSLPASQLTGPIPAAQLSGPLPPTALSGAYPAAVSFHNSSNQFAGDGSQLANVNATSLNGLTASNFWQLNGNAGTTPGTNFLGTTDNHALEFKVNNLRALRLEPRTNGSPNIIGGAAGNSVGTTVLTSLGVGNYTLIFYPTGTYGATISGGGSATSTNLIVSHFGTIAGGAGNNIEMWQQYAVVGGGFSNRIGTSGANTQSAYSTIGGGCSNQIFSPGGVIGGGIQNRISFNQAERFEFCHVIGGGFNNRIGSDVGYATIGGGRGNVAAGWDSTIAGGRDNFISWNGSIFGDAIGGGNGNYILSGGGYSVISGGRSNRVTGTYSSIPGGFRNTAEQSFTLAAGHRAQAVHSGSFVWADSRDVDFASTTTNTFSVRATGGTHFVSAIDTNGIPTAGVELPAGGGAWASLSDRDSKENFTPVDPREVLQRVNQMPISNWNYKSQDQAIRHIGPTAQDFAAAFQVGESDRRITTVDADGVALAAIQGLSQIVTEKDEQIKQLQQRLERLEQLLNSSTANRP
jgi:hypothetical protein